MIAVGALIAALWTMEAVPVVPLSPIPDDPVEVPENIQSRPASTPIFARRSRSSSSSASGSIWYWRHPAKNSWELHFDWNDWRAKMFSTRMVVFDNDLFATNGLAHPFAGAIYYQVARGNGLSPLASFVASFLTSTAWEYLAEWDEKPSTNDLIFTPAGGAVIGEATYRLGRMFAAGSPSMGNCMGALLFSPIATLNEARVCRTGERQPTDEFGLPARTWHYLAFNLGQAYFSFDGGAGRHRGGPRFRRRRSSIITVTDSRERASAPSRPASGPSSPGRTSSPTAGCVASGFMPAVPGGGATTATTRRPTGPPAGGRTAGG